MLDTIGGRRFGGCCPYDSTAVHSALRTDSHPPSRRRAIATAVLERAPKAQKGRRPKKRKRPSLCVRRWGRGRGRTAFSEAVETQRGSTQPWGGYAGMGADVPFVSTILTSRNEPRSFKDGPRLSWRRSLPKWVAGGHTSLTGEWTCTRITAETRSDVFCAAGSGAERRRP